MAGSSVPSLEEEKAKNIEFECITFGPYYLATVCKTEEVKRMIIRRHGKGKKGTGGGDGKLDATNEFDRG